MSSDDIVARLYAPYVEPCTCVDIVRAECRSCNDRIDAKAEIERLRAALAIAAGMISTTPQHENKHPELVIETLLQEVSERADHRF